MSEALLAAAREEAARLSHGFVGTEHLLLALLRLQEPALVGALEAAGVTPAHAQSRLEKGRRGRRPPVRPGEDGQPGLTSHARRALDAAGGVPAALVEGFLRDEGSLLTRLLRPGETPKLQAPSGERPVSNPEGPPPRSAEPRDPPKPPRVREPRPKRERPPAGGEERSRSRVPDGERSRRGEPRRTAAAVLDEEPPFVPRLAVQPRKRRRFPWAALLLLLVPGAIALDVSGASPETRLLAAAVAILPLAAMLGSAAEQLSARAGPAAGGVLSAVVGHAAVAIIAVSALRAGLAPLVKAVIIGGIVANLLLVPGLALLARGTAPPAARPNRTTAGVGGAMLTLAIAVLALPTVAQPAGPVGSAQGIAPVPLAAAALLVLTLLCALLHSLRTRQRLLGGESAAAPDATWSGPRAVLVILVAIAGVLALTGMLLNATQDVMAASGRSPLVFGLILIPLTAGAAAQWGAIRAGRRGETDLAIRIPVAAALQSILVLAPLLVTAGLLLGTPVDLIFTPFELATVAIAGLGAALSLREGEAHWLTGVQLLSVYLLIAIAAWFI